MWGQCIFMRAAGIRHSALSKLISDHSPQRFLPGILDR
jgi:hypothetical protein